MGGGGSGKRTVSRGFSLWERKSSSHGSYTILLETQTKTGPRVHIYPCLPSFPRPFPICSRSLTPGFCSSKRLLNKDQRKFLVMSTSPADFQRGWAVPVHSSVQAPWLGGILETLGSAGFLPAVC